MKSHRLLAFSSFVLTVVGTLLLVAVSIGRMPRGLAAVAIVVVAGWIARYGVLRRGAHGPCDCPRPRAPRGRS